MSRKVIPLLVLFSAAAAFAACPGGGTAPNAGAGADAGPADAGPGENAADAGDAGPQEAMDANMMTMDAGIDAGMCDPLAGVGGGMVSPQCRMCVENASACMSDLTNYSNDCTAYSTCICNCGNGRNCAMMCQSSVTMTCQNDIQAVGTCAAQNCQSECLGGGRDGGGFSFDAGTGDAGFLPDGGTWCGALAPCCASLTGQAASLMGRCEMAAQAGNDNQCEQELSLAQRLGQCMDLGNADAGGDAG
jgi:hypothetical protein